MILKIKYLSSRQDNVILGKAGNEAVGANQMPFKVAVFCGYFAKKMRL